MKPPTLNLSLVAGTAGQYAVAWSESGREWLILRITQQPGKPDTWVRVDAHVDERKARRLAYLLYVFWLGETDL